MSREIILLLEELPINYEMLMSINQQIQRMPVLQNQTINQNAPMWAELLSQSQNGSVPASGFYNIMLMHECIIGGGGSLQRRAKVNKVTAAQQPVAETVTQFVQMFIERGGLIFLTSFFSSLDKSGLESCTIKYKALTMLIEIVSQLLSSRWQKTISEMMTE